MKIIRFYFFLILCQSVTFSQTSVSGNVSGVWTITNSPYIVTNNLVLQPTDTLIINPGVEVRFDGYYRFDIFGTFFAVGIVSDSIIFTRNENTNWGSLNFADASNDSSKIQYCIIEYGSSSGYTPYYGVINCFESSPLIANSTIRNNYQKSIYAYGSNAQPLILANKFQNNSDGVFISSSAQPTIEENEFINNDNTAIYINNSSNTVINDNNISGNTGYGIYLEQYCSSTQITNNIIIANNNSGIYLYDQNNYVSIQNNTISNNFFGIHLNSSNDNVVIENNVISSNPNRGIGIYADNSNFYILNNIISNNSGDGIVAQSCNGDIIGNLVIDNGHRGIGLYSTGNCEVKNNTIDGHILYGIIVNSSNSTLIAENNSVTNNGNGIYSNGNVGTYSSIAYNNSWNNTTDDYVGGLPSGTGNFTNVNLNGAICDVYYNISENPVYTDTTNNDFTLQPGSPNISAGDPSYTDPDGTISDIGAFYFDTPHYTPEADFIGDTLSGNPLLNVNFTDLSQISDAGNPIISWLWDFGDDSFSNEQNPAHTYQLSGNYTVTLSITDSIGFIDTEIKENYINLFATEVHNLGIGVDEDLQHLISHEPIITFDFYNTENDLQTHYQVQVSTDTTFTIIDMWDTGEVASSDTSILYAGSDLIDGQIYYLRVKVAAGSFWSDWISLSFRMNSMPLIPSLVSPINNQVVDEPILLTINSSEDPEDDLIQYVFYVFDDNSRQVFVDSSGLVDDTTWIVQETLADNNQYWWYAKAYDGYEYSDLAIAESFLVNTENNVPNEFSLLFPDINGEITTLLPTFIWRSSFDPDPLDTVRYTLYLDTPDPGVLAYETGVDTTWQVTEPLLDNQEYFWKVVAGDMLGFEMENIGGYQQFTTNSVNEPPSVVNLLSPDSVIVLTLFPEFHWTEAIDPDPEDSVHYELHWVKDGDDFVDSVLTDTNYAIPYAALDDNSKFYWWVISMDRQYDLSQSEEAVFWTDLYPEPPLAFNTVSPVDSTEELSSDVTFIWNKTNDPDPLDIVSYTLILREDSTLMFRPAHGDTIITVSLTIDTEYFWWIMANDEDGQITFSDNGAVNRLVVGTLSIGDNLVPVDFTLHQNYPNPFNPITTLLYDLPENSFVNITIYDMLGRQVRTLINQTQDAGYKSVIWNATNDHGNLVSAGVYLYQIQAGEYVQTKKMVVLK